MTREKFVKDTQTLLQFIQLYCDKQHRNVEKKITNLELVYKNTKVQKEIHFELCSSCQELFEYSYARLQECPQDPKPRCRKCPNPCYEKIYWKRVAKIMRFSGIQLGLLKVKKLFTPKS